MPTASPSPQADSYEEVLRSLGYLIADDELALAVEQFQRVHGLEPTGVIDDATQAWLHSGDAWPRP